MHLSPKNRRNISRIIPFGIIWIVLGWIFLFVETAATPNLDNLPETAIRLNPYIFLFASMAVGFVGLLVGTIEIVYLNNVFSRYNFLTKLFGKLLIYSIFLFTIILILFPIAASLEMQTSVFDSKVWERYLRFATSITNISTNVQLAASLLVSLFYFEISELIGQKVLINVFKGKYHQPKVEMRIFMFADMKSSTTIAEKLGHVKYFELLDEYYRDFSDAIINHAGEVYQYIGDEIVISWTLENGLREGNCIKCYQAVKDRLDSKKVSYQQRFGAMPDFKASIHLGEVTTGEIGALKKEIIFTGDVLNTTARIQALCDQLGVDLLVSEDLKGALSEAILFSFKNMGAHVLKGKKGKVELYTIN